MASSARAAAAHGRAVRSPATGGATRRSASAGVRTQARECGRAGGAAWAWAGEVVAGLGRSAAGAKARRGGRPGRLCGWAESEAAARE